MEKQNNVAEFIDVPQNLREALIAYVRDNHMADDGVDTEQDFIGHYAYHQLCASTTVDLRTIEEFQEVLTVDLLQSIGYVREMDWVDNDTDTAWSVASIMSTISDLDFEIEKLKVEGK